MSASASPVADNATFPVDPSSPDNLALDIKEFIRNTYTEELVLTLCGFIGTDIHGVGDSLQKILEGDFGYKVEVIKLSTFIKTYAAAAANVDQLFSGYEKTRKLIEGGNNLRETYDPSILAQLAIQRISYDRIKEKSGEAFKSVRKCFIVDSIKNVEEFELFKMVYNDIHYSIGIFSPLETRVNHLAHGSKSMREDEIYSLINRDSGEEVEHGQQVRDTFTRSDYFLRLDENVNDLIEMKLRRFISLIFGVKVVTPTADETAMYHAASAASNSACLSRQVGAALTDVNGEILSIGWNDVPRADGGLYQSSWNSDPLRNEDKRCYNLGEGGCWNDREKNFMADELVDILIADGIVPPENRLILFQKIRNSKIKSLVEFSRSIHAEMHALISGCQATGNRVKRGKLYITTYPCHNCARHIIVAGIKKVYYIEPYRKSLTTKLHFDAITEKEESGDKVEILMYDGVAPSRYMDLFKMLPDSRKIVGVGSLKPHDSKKAKPKGSLSLEAIPVLESKVAAELGKKGLKIANQSL